MDLKDYFATWRSKWYVVLLITIIGAGLGFGISSLTSPTYSSTTKFAITAIGGGDTGGGSDLLSLQRTASYGELMKSQRLGQKLVESLKLDQDASTVADNITPAIVPPSAIFTVTVKANSAANAENIAKALPSQLKALIDEIQASNAPLPPVGTIALAQPSVNVAVVQNPTFASSSAGSDRFSKIAIGVGFGIILGLIVPIVMRLTSRRLRDPREVRDALGEVPQLGEISHKRRGKIWAPDSASADQFRDTLAKLQITSGSARVILTTALSDEGQAAYVAAGLASAIAERGHRVVVVEANLREPRLANLLDTPRNPGLAQYLSENESAEAIIRAPREIAAATIVSGIKADNVAASVALSSPRLAELMTRLRAQYDYVVVAGPRTSGHADVALVGRNCDTALLVADSRSAKSDLEAVAAGHTDTQSPGAGWVWVRR